MPYAIEDTSFIAVDGGGLDARVREGVSSTLTRTVAAILAAALALFIVGSMSVATTSATVAILDASSGMKSDIKELRAENEDLRIACSLLSSSERITRIATQNLGMVYAQDAQHFELN
jgi:cell division protein FtsL